MSHKGLSKYILLFSIIHVTLGMGIYYFIFSHKKEDLQTIKYYKTNLYLGNLNRSIKHDSEFTQKLLETKLDDNVQKEQLTELLSNRSDPNFETKLYQNIYELFEDKIETDNFSTYIHTSPTISSEHLSKTLRQIATHGHHQLDQVYLLYDAIKESLFYVYDVIDPTSNQRLGYIIHSEHDPILKHKEQEYHISLMLFLLTFTIGFVFTFRELKNKDLLEKKNREKSMILEYANTGIGTMNLAGNFLTCNNYFSSLFGYEKAEFLKQNLIDLVPQSERANLLANLKSSKIGQQSITNTLIAIKRSHKPIHVEYTIQYDPRSSHYVIILNSLEDKITIEEQNKILLNINQTLKKKVDDEVEKNIRQHTFMVKEQMESIKFASIGKLAAGVTHEINTPLTYVKANFEMLYDDLQMLPDNELKSELMQSADSIEDGITRIKTIVESMHEMAQKPKTAKECINLYDSLVTALTITYNRAKHISAIYIQNNRFAMATPKGKYAFFTRGYKQRLEQVFVIIINNALDELVKIEPIEDRRLSITLQEKGKNIIIRFEDNAGGIEESMLPKIFNAFESSKESSGMGVGLNIASQIIHDHDGTLTASNGEKGAIFEITLQLADEKSKPTPEAEALAYHV